MPGRGRLHALSRSDFAANGWGALAGVLIGVVFAAAAMLTGQGGLRDLPGADPSAGEGRARGVAELISTPNMAGWRHEGGGQLDATVEAGATVYTATGGPGRLVFGRPLGRFELRLEFSLATLPADAGLLLELAGEQPGSQPLEIDIANDDAGQSTTGAFVGVQSPMVYVAPAQGEWHSLRVAWMEERATVWIDDAHVNDHLVGAGGPAAPPSGGTRIGIAHSRGSVRFRDIRLVELTG